MICYSDDGKKAGSYEEVLAYEKEKQENKKAEEEKRKALEVEWNSIQELLNQLNHKVKAFKKESTELVTIGVSNGNYFADKSSKGHTFEDTLYDLFKYRGFLDDGR